MSLLNSGGGLDLNADLKSRIYPPRSCWMGDLDPLDADFFTPCNGYPAGGAARHAVPDASGAIAWLRFLSVEVNEAQLYSLRNVLSYR